MTTIDPCPRITHGLLAGLVLLAGLLLSDGAQAQRVALLIGNSAYAVGALRNPPNDVREMAEADRQRRC